MTNQIIKISPLYHSLSSGNLENWNALRSPKEDLVGPLSQRAPDFSIHDIQPLTWKDTLQKVTLRFLKCTLLFPWGLYDGLNYLTQRLAMTALYPIQSRAVQLLARQKFSTSALDHQRQELTEEFQERGYIVRHVSLEKNGTHYSGLLIGHRETIYNGQWVIQAGGNAQAIEDSAYLYAPCYKEQRFNTLLINGPGVGRSEGEATPLTMGEAQEIGISFLESAIKAKKIVIAGLSLGGAAMGQAILLHHFKPDTSYCVIRQVTFDQASRIAGVFASRVWSKLRSFTEHLIRWCGAEMDSVLASRKLQQLGIHEVIMQATNKEIPTGTLPTAEDFASDGVIPAEASLGYRLIQEGITQHKTFCCLPQLSHGNPLWVLPDAAVAPLRFMDKRSHPLFPLYSTLDENSNHEIVQHHLNQLQETLRHQLYFKVWELSTAADKHQERWGERIGIRDHSLLKQAIEALSNI